MKSLFLSALVLFSAASTSAQVSGNATYQQTVRYPEQSVNVYLSDKDVTGFSVKGLANLKADQYVAVFSLAQSAKTAEEAIRLLDSRIAGALAALKPKYSGETFVDAISFVPLYEYEGEKKLFSKRTYNEIPKGFEVKKNIHLRYTDESLLQTLIATMAEWEIYDLVRVDYYSDKMEATRAALAGKARTLLVEKIKTAKLLLGTKMDSGDRKMAETYRVVYPIEQYKSYQAYSSTELNSKKMASAQVADKTTTQYYQPIMDKEFDFVINPIVVEPVIQVLYEVKLQIDDEPASAKKDRSYFVVTPAGELKELKLGE